MDHLPHLKDPYDPVPVPDLGGEEYDRSGFFDFPSRHGWPEGRLANSSLNTETRLEAAQVFQTWLFLGTLSEVLGVNVPRSRFSRVGMDGKKWVTTARLPEYLLEWRDRVRSRKGVEMLEQKKHMNNCFDAVGRTFRGRKGSSAVDILGEEIALSVVILVSTLAWCATRVYRVSSENASTVESMMTQAIGLLKPRLLKSGWCPSMIVRMAGNVGHSGLYYASLLGPRRNKKEHGDCSDDGCVANRFDETTYATKHTRDGCNCAHVGPDVEKISSILGAGLIPVVSTDAGAVRVEVAPASRGTAYIAVSHVWSDGLGNCESNSLPRCQLQLLRQRARAAFPRVIKEEEPVFFWMDTLCVPVRLESGRKSAIKQMRRVYREAASVLVLDTDLILSSVDCGAEEIFTRIISSGWFQRLWTLQEAALARNLVVQFLERCVDVTLLSDAMFKNISIQDEIASRLFFIFIQPQLIFSDKAVSSTERFCIVWQSLIGRSTSKAEDEPICVATLLGMPVDVLAETPGSDRMQKFWSLRHDVPLGLLFVNGPKLSAHGFRWAPSTFLRRKNARKLFMDLGSAYCSPGGGLTLKTPGILLSSYKWTDPNISSRFFCFIEKISRTRYSMYMEPGDGNPSFRDISLQSLESPGIVLREDLNDRKLVAGVLVSVSRTEGQKIFVNFVGRTRIFQEGGAVDKLWRLTELKRSGNSPIGVGESTKRNQEWCIF